MVTKKLVKTTQISAGYSAKTIEHIINIPLPEIDGADFQHLTNEDLTYFIDEITLHAEEIEKNLYALLLPNPTFIYLSNVEGFKRAKVRVKIHQLTTSKDINQFLERYQLKYKAVQLLCFECIKPELDYAIKDLNSDVLNNNVIASIANRVRSGMGRKK